MSEASEPAYDVGPVVQPTSERRLCGCGARHDVHVDGTPAPHEDDCHHNGGDMPCRSFVPGDRVWWAGLPGHIVGLTDDGELVVVLDRDRIILSQDDVMPEISPTGIAEQGHHNA